MACMVKQPLVRRRHASSIPDCRSFVPKHDSILRTGRPLPLEEGPTSLPLTVHACKWMLGYRSCLGIIDALPILVYSSGDPTRATSKIEQAGPAHRILTFEKTRCGCLGTSFLGAGAPHSHIRSGVQKAPETIYEGFAG